MAHTTTPVAVPGPVAPRFFRVEITEVTDGNRIWDSKLTEADRPAAFWTVTPSPGFFALGHLVTIDDKNGWRRPSALTLSPRAGWEDLLRPPVRVERIWDDAGTGASRDLKIWRMVAPDGYVALGDIISASDTPDLSTVRCVRRTALVDGEKVNLTTRSSFRNHAPEGRTTAEPYWNDAGSKADRDLSIWLMQVESTPGTGQIHLVPGTFHGSTSGVDAPTFTPAALVLDFPDAVAPESRPVPEKQAMLTGRRLPTKAELQATKRITTFVLPFFAVRDPDFDSQLEQFRASPQYTVEQTTEYEAIDSFAPVNTETKEYSVTVGTATETNYSNEVGAAIGLSVEVGGDVGVASVAVTASVEVSYSHTWGGATTTSEERSFTYPQTVSGGSFGALFQARSSYLIRRLDGTRVGAPVEVRINEFYTDEWPRPGQSPTGEPALLPQTPDSAEKVTITIDAPAGRVVVFEGRWEIRDGRVAALPPVALFPDPDRTLQLPAGAIPVPMAGRLPTSYTKEAWVKATDPEQDQNILSGGTGSQHAFWLKDGRVSAGHNNNWLSVVDPTPAGTHWEHHAVTYDGATGEMCLYRGGVLVAQRSGVPAPAGAGALLVGGYTGGPSFRGELADVRMWDVVRTTAEIARDRWQVVPIGTPGLIGRQPS